MTRTATILLVLLALAVGFYLGSNPAAHEKATQAWQDTKTFLIELGAKINGSIKDMSLKFDQTASNNSASQFSSDQTQVNTDQTANAPTQPGSFLDARELWDSLRSIWVQLTTRFKAAIS